MIHRFSKREPARGRRPGRGRRAQFPEIRAGADAGLKKVFAGIGVPEMAPFVPDPYQLEALKAVEQGDCLVTAPTGAGKTWIAEQAIQRMLARGRRSWYASPLKALSNAIYGAFSARFGADRVGILTGDRKENPTAPVIVGTTEILRNQLYDAMHRGETLDTDLAVLDEAHFLGDEERGVVWEEVMIYLPQRVPLLMLSATVGNARQIADWLTQTRAKPCRVVAETQRPVPLFPLFMHPSGSLFPLTASAGAGKRPRLHKKVRSYLSDPGPVLMAPPNRLPPFGDVLSVLRKFHLLPALFFLKSRADCNQAVALCRGDLSEDRDRADRRREAMAVMAAQSPHIALHRQRKHIEEWAVGAHHAGQLPAWKLVLETLMNQGLLDAVFATSTVAAGVNFPARTVVFLNTDRFNGRAFAPLDPTEFHQMTGRAGRRGMDNIGFAVALPGKYMDLRLAAALVSAPPSDVHSRIHVNFSMVLNLLLSHTPGQIQDLLARSFAAHRMHHARTQHSAGHPVPDGAALLTEDFRRHMSFLRETGYVGEDGGLTRDGVWASRLRVDQPLLIAEGFRTDAFPAADPALLASVVASLVSDREERENGDDRSGPRRLRTAFAGVKRSLLPFQRLVAARGFETRPLQYRPAANVFQWLSGRPFEEIVAEGGIEEGDLVMLVLRTADNLRHICALRPFFPEAARTAREAVERMLRDPVVMEHPAAEADEDSETETDPGHPRV